MKRSPATNNSPSRRPAIRLRSLFRGAEPKGEKAPRGPFGRLGCAEDARRLWQVTRNGSYDGLHFSVLSVKELTAGPKILLKRQRNERR